MGRWLAALIVLTFSASAWANDDAKLTLRVPTKVDGISISTAPATTAAEPATRPKKRTTGYRDVLSTLAIARDLQIPGAPMSLRLIPTSRALSGEQSSAPIILRPRVSGGGGGYGVDIAARF